MRRKRWLLASLLILGVVATAVYQQWFSLEARLEGKLLGVLEAGRVSGYRSHGERDRELQKTLSEVVDPDVVVRCVDLPKIGDGWHTLLTWGRLAGQFDESRVDVQASELVFDANGVAATGNLRLAFVGRRGDQTVLDERTVRARFASKDGRWLISVIEVDPRPRDLPEARP